MLEVIHETLPIKVLNNVGSKNVFEDLAKNASERDRSLCCYSTDIYKSRSCKIKSYKGKFFYKNDNFWVVKITYYKHTKDPSLPSI